MRLTVPHRAGIYLYQPSAYELRIYPVAYI